MHNIRNSFQVIGRLTKDPTVFDNADGSKKVRVIVAAADNFANKNGEFGSQFLPLEAFIPAKMAADKGIGIYGQMHTGDFVAFTGTIQNNNYKDKNGQDHYDLVLRIETIDLLEPKSVTVQRMTKRAAAASGAEAEETAE